MSKTILLADDSVTIRKVVELTLMDEPYELVSVGSGSEALEKLSSEIDLVIADVHMPGADGYEVCQEVKQRTPGVPVMLLVGTFESYDADKADAAGADDHLKKPFDSQDLLARVRGLLASSRAVDPVGGEEPAPQPEPELEPEPEPEPELEPESGSPGAAAVMAPLAEEGIEPAAAATSVEPSDATVDRIARRVVELLSEETVREVAWEVIPDLAEIVIKERLSELESEVE